MLLFIGSILVKIAEDAEFQYTSCYSLSSSASCFSFLLPGFNTSHVTLYRPSSGLEKCSQDRFNTSHVTLYLWNVYQKWKLKLCFNTSHVTLYLYQFHSLKKLLLCFNTSHVTLYPGHPFKCGWMGWVSIHLMLLFICLRNARFVHFSISFNTSHVTLYHGIRQCTIQKQSRFNTSHVTLYHPVKIRFRWD